ncbi:MAG TPA: hypothetical protein VN181_14045 [Thermoanaerobaculia bacterium]|nr:hypothetical protein [Thermoanaerobaculia bacterium]
MFNELMTVEAALALHPKARWVFAAYQISGCVDCTSSKAETLAEVADGYRFDLAQFLADLNSLVDLECGDASRRSGLT